MTAPERVRSASEIGRAARRTFTRAARILVELSALEGDTLIAVDVGLASGGGGVVDDLANACEVYAAAIRAAYADPIPERMP